MSRFLRAALLGAAAFAIPAALNLVLSRQRRELVNTLCLATAASTLGRSATSHIRCGGKGTPLVLIHGVGAGESSYEWRHNFEALAERYQVYAFDLPGFGKSARRNSTYTADLYVTALIDFLRDVVKEPAVRGSPAV